MERAGDTALSVGDFVGEASIERLGLAERAPQSLRHQNVVEHERPPGMTHGEALRRDKTVLDPGQRAAPERRVAGVVDMTAQRGDRNLVVA